jgi:hypothetical protein
MNFIDIFIFIFCIAGLVYFAFNRIKYSNIKYSNKNVYFQKLEKLDKLQTLINKIKSDNDEMELLISLSNKDFDINDIHTDKLIKYRDNKEKLKNYNDEYKKIESYLNKARSFIT